MKKGLFKDQIKNPKIICVENIPEDIENKSIHRLFSVFGSIKEYKRLMNCNSGYLNFCYLTYKDESSLFYVYKYLNNYSIDKYSILIEIVKENKDNTDEGKKKDDNIDLENMEGLIVSFVKGSSKTNVETYGDLRKITIEISTEIEHNEVFKGFMNKDDILERCFKLQDKLIRRLNENEEQEYNLRDILEKYMF